MKTTWRLYDSFGDPITLEYINITGAVYTFSLKTKDKYNSFQEKELDALIEALQTARDVHRACKARDEED